MSLLVSALSAHAITLCLQLGCGVTSLIFGGFAHDPQDVLTAVNRFTDVIAELLANFLYRVAGKMTIRLELGIAAFAYAEG
jgi:hypothetical protein